MLFVFIIKANFPYYIISSPIDSSYFGLSMTSLEIIFKFSMFVNFLGCKIDSEIDWDVL